MLIRGLNTLAATVCTPLAAPVLCATRLRGGTAASARGADALVAEALGTSRACGATGWLVMRGDSAFYAAAAGQVEPFQSWRYHAIFTDSPFTMLQAEAQHRDHAGAIEQTFADLTNGPLAHLPSAIFKANAAWLTCAAITHNLLRATATLASAFHARARGATLRRHLINIPARLARHGRGHLTLHLPEHWPWAPAWLATFQAVHPPPAATA